MMTKANIALWGTAALLLLTLVAVAAIKLWPIINPPITMTLPYDAACNLHQGPCTTTLTSGAKVTLSIEPRPIPVVHPIQLQATLSGITSDQVMVDIQGIDMNMGINRPQLQQRTAGVFSGNSILPICIRDRMHWEARVLIQSEEGIIAIPFRFTTERE